MAALSHLRTHRIHPAIVVPRRARAFEAPVKVASDYFGISLVTRLWFLLSFEPEFTSLAEIVAPWKHSATLLIMPQERLAWVVSLRCSFMHPNIPNQSPRYSSRAFLGRPQRGFLQLQEVRPNNTLAHGHEPLFQHPVSYIKLLSQDLDLAQRTISNVPSKFQSIDEQD